jgi:hypothetical protein
MSSARRVLLVEQGPMVATVGTPHSTPVRLLRKVEAKDWRWGRGARVVREELEPGATTTVARVVLDKRQPAQAAVVVVARVEQLVWVVPGTPEPLGLAGLAGRGERCRVGLVARQQEALVVQERCGLQALVGRRPARVVVKQVGMLEAAQVEMVATTGAAAVVATVPLAPVAAVGSVARVSSSSLIRLCSIERRSLC